MRQEGFDHNVMLAGAPGAGIGLGGQQSGGGVERGRAFGVVRKVDFSGQRSLERGKLIELGGGEGLQQGMRERSQVQERFNRELMQERPDQPALRRVAR